jgi:hypothetical protein
MHYKKKNGKRHRERTHGFRHSTKCYSWRLGGVLRKHLRTILKIEEDI